MVTSSSEKVVEFFFGIGSRYSYLAATQVEHVERDTGVRFTWRPILSQELMNRRGQNPFVELSAEGNWNGAVTSQTYTETYRQTDLKRWADLYGVSYNEPLAPKIDVKRRTLFCVAAEIMDQAAVYSRAMFNAVYVERRPIDEDDCLELAVACGLEGRVLQRHVDDGSALRHHEATIIRAMNLGVFGVPTFAWNGELYFGNDRIVLLKKALSGG